MPNEMIRDVSELKETIAWGCWTRYRDGYLKRSNFSAVARELRDYYRGENEMDEGRPNINLCREYVEKVTAKIVGVSYSMQFNADVEQMSLHKLDDFYAYQMAQIDDKEFTARICALGIREGVGVAYTSYDEDTYGTKGLYRGCIKRMNVPFERNFFENPYCENLQDQRYLGYVMSMEVGAVKELIEGSAQRKARLRKLVIPDECILADGRVDEDRSDSDSKKVSVVVRFFRDKDGEVLFEMATQFVDIYTEPHYLNPRRNKTYRKEIQATDDDGGNPEYVDKSEQKYTLFTPAKRMSDKEYRDSRNKFWRYPVAMYRPYPIENQVLGESGMKHIIPNQDIINYNYYLNSEIIKAHAGPKWLYKREALQGQVIDDEPWQAICDHTPFNQGTWGITRLSGDPISNGMLDATNQLLTLTKSVNGFDNLSSDNMSSDISGYAYQQYVKQMNLTLEIPQQRLWNYLKENARTDLLYFRFYIDEARYYTTTPEGEFSLEETYQGMAQDIVNAGYDENFRPGTDLNEINPLRRVNSRTVVNDDFMLDWEVAVECQQGIAGSDISESQHINQLMQYVMTGNADAPMVKAMIECDPAISRKVRSNFQAALEAVNNSEIQQKNQEIAQCKQVIQQLSTQLKRQGQQVSQMNTQLKAYKQATIENARMNQAVAEDAASRSQGEVKSDNSRGISGEEASLYEGAEGI